MADCAALMSTHLLTPRMAGLLERIQRARRPPFHAMTPQQARAAYEAAAEVLDLPRAPLASIRDMALPAFDGTPLAARRYRANAATRGTLLYLHGGGFTIGGLATHDSLCRQLALHSSRARLRQGNHLVRVKAAVWRAEQHCQHPLAHLGEEGVCEGR